MLLKKNGIDIFYIDESHDRHVFVVTAVCIPFLRMNAGNIYDSMPGKYQNKNVSYASNDAILRLK